MAIAEGKPFVARRILVGIDASNASLDALEAAASLAARLGSELAGLFVEDEDLLRLAALPFGDIVRSPSGERERLDRASVEATLRAVASHAREVLERTAA
jgi:nucleotide-binding universal stress UspA family protein